jgi:16S rRNA (guanine527-N7)-methyltransferase
MPFQIEPFEIELRDVLPADLPQREHAIAKGAEHLTLIEEANRQFNLTRITSPREAAVKHVLDSVMPWRLFEGARRILDAGTGAGFPGIPLALVLPEVRFTFSESIQKKARFVEHAVQTLKLANAEVSSRRAEELLNEQRADLVTLRAVAPLVRAIPLLARAIQAGTKVLAYKGPDIEQEMAEAAQEAHKRKVRMEIVMRYELPEGAGSRSIVELKCW